MTSKPILFSGQIVRAILEGRKTQTRRAVKGRPAYTPNAARCQLNAKIDEPWWQWLDADGSYHGDSAKCPYGIPGDRLWVRETWQEIGSDRPAGYWTNPALKGKDFWYRATDDLPTWGGKWKPSIYMPRMASRLTLEITGVRVERLQEITATDAHAEGIAYAELSPSQEKRVCRKRSAAQFVGKPELVNDINFAAIQKYAVLWDSINGKKHPWASNPWVFVISFERIEAK